MAASSIDPEKFVAARKASNLTLKQAADLVRLSIPGYKKKEVDPSYFRLGELEQLYNGMNGIGQSIFKEAIEDIFLPNELSLT